MGAQTRGTVAPMIWPAPHGSLFAIQLPPLSWHWPWVALLATFAAVASVSVAVLVSRTRHGHADPVFSLDDDLGTEHAARLLRLWRTLGRLAWGLLCAAVCASIVLMARPMRIGSGDERSSRRDIILCLDVSGSTLPYDRELIATYRDLVRNFQGERIGLSIFNSTSRTVFPLTDDYDLVVSQLDHASDILKGVQSQDDIDAMSDRDYQRISDWLEGTQNRKEATSLIGDGLVSCAAMLPGFSYGSPHAETAMSRSASIVLATDNVVSGTPSYTLSQALRLTQQVGIGVDGLYSGPPSSASDEATLAMKRDIESHGGAFLTQGATDSVDALVRGIERRKDTDTTQRSQASLVDDPGVLTAIIAALVLGWLICAWRLRR